MCFKYTAHLAFPGYKEASEAHKQGIGGVYCFWSVSDDLTGLGIHWEARHTAALGKQMVNRFIAHRHEGIARHPALKDNGRLDPALRDH